MLCGHSIDMNKTALRIAFRKSRFVSMISELKVHQIHAV